MKIRKAVIPAAGFGTRLLPATIAQPKEMLPIVDKPTIQFAVEEATEAGLLDILIITGRTKRAIEDHFDPSPELLQNLKENGKLDLLSEIKVISSLGHIHFIRQKSPKGLGDAILQASCHIGNEPFAVLLGDTIIWDEKGNGCIQDLIKIYQKFKKSVVAVEEVSKEKIERYGIIKGQKLKNNLYQIEDLLEKPKPEKAPSNLAIASRYILTPLIFKILKKTKPDKRGEVQLTDALALLAQKEELLALKIQGKRYDIGNRLDYAQAFLEIGLKRKDIGQKLKKFLKKSE